MLPDATNSAAPLKCSMLRRCVPTWTTRLCLRAASRMALPLVNRLAERLLDVDVLARLAGENRHARVPVIGSRDHHRVDLLIVEHAAEVVFEARLVALRLGDIGPGLLQHLGVEIAEGLESRARADGAQRVAIALVAPADQGQA